MISLLNQSYLNKYNHKLTKLNIINALLKKDRYKINLYIDGILYKTISKGKNKKIILNNPSKEGYTFLGWQNVPELMPANDIEIHGSFKINSYNITYYIDNEIYLVKTYLFNEKIIPEEFPIKEGYTFLGWSEIPATMPANDVTVIGSFTVNEYQVTYVLDSEIYQTVTVSYGSTLVLPEVAEREGYTFSGWSGVPETMPANDITTIGSFSVNYYIVKYYIDDELFSTEEVAYGSTIPILEVPSKEGYEFIWQNVPETMPAKDITINGFYLDYYSIQYLTFTALEDSTFKLTKNACEYSLDNGSTWVNLPSGTTTTTVSAGNKIMFKCTNPTISTTYPNYGIGTFSSTGKFNVEGNIMSMLYGDDFVGQTDLTDKNYAFCNLFSGCTTVVNAKDLILPATTLADWCYSSMFSNCTSLISAPELPATILAPHCYGNMFYKCTSLTNAPELSATTLGTSCYQYMFQGCASLTSAPELPATTLTIACYESMFYGCTSLTNAPELSATTLTQQCYRSMFEGCTSLNYIKMLATNISASLCLYNWVSNVSSTGTFVKNKNATWNTTGTSGIPSGWEVQEI